MLRSLPAALLAAAVVAAAPADARMHAPYRAHRIVPANAAPLDSFSTPSGAYSFRKLISGYAGSAVKLQRVDTTTQDIGFVGTDFDTAAAAAFCTTACTVQTWYDQSGNGRNLVQATAANQPAYVASCAGGRPCAQSDSTDLLGGSSFTPATGVVSLNIVASRTSGVGPCGFLRENGLGAANSVTGSNGVASNWRMVGGTSGFIGAAATDAAWHTAIGLMNGASSSLSVDGAAAVTGTVTGNTGAGVPVALAGTATTVCSLAEAVFWDNYLLSAPEAAALAQNQQNYWMPAPLDSFTQPSGAYSFRKLKSTYAGPAIRIRRASDNLETDINFLGCTGFTGCPWDSAAATAHCAATTCFVRTWYDQSGVARDLPQASAAAQPTLVFNCIGANPCVRHPSGSMFLLSSGSITPATGILSISAVAQRSGGVGSCLFFRENGATGNRLIGGAANAWTLTSNTTPINATAADGAFHAALGVVNGASSVLGIDGTETAGTVSPANVTAGTAGTSGATSATCDDSEIVLWDNYPLTAGERAALGANQRSFWGTP